MDYEIRMRKKMFGAVRVGVCVGACVGGWVGGWCS